MGTQARPFRGTQSIDAAIALLTLGQATVRPRQLHAWGYGPAVDPARTYFYEDASGSAWPLRFLSRAGAANRLNYSEAEAHRALERLIGDVSASRHVDPDNTMFVGCSWGAAVIDYGASSDRNATLTLPGPGVAIGGPRSLLAWSRLRVPALRALSDNGDHGRLWVQRHPDDPIGLSGIGPALYLLKRGFHDYRSLSRRSDSTSTRFWGISG